MAERTICFGKKSKVKKRLPAGSPSGEYGRSRPVSAVESSEG